MEDTGSWLLPLLFTCSWVQNGAYLDFSPAQQSIINDLSWGLKSLILAESDARKVGIERLVARQGSTPSTDQLDEELKLKMFRMMYESISDSDAKLKRADMIRRAYENSTSFELGFIIADATDKYTTMVDISQMLNKMFDYLKPIEYINAYEHIANKAIEISQLMELAKAVANRNATTYRRAFVNVGL